MNYVSVTVIKLRMLIRTILLLIRIFFHTIFPLNRTIFSCLIALFFIPNRTIFSVFEFFQDGEDLCVGRGVQTILKNKVRLRTKIVRIRIIHLHRSHNLHKSMVS